MRAAWRGAASGAGHLRGRVNSVTGAVVERRRTIGGGPTFEVLSHLGVRVVLALVRGARHDARGQCVTPLSQLVCKPGRKHEGGIYTIMTFSELD